MFGLLSNNFDNGVLITTPYRVTLPDRGIQQ